MPSPKNKRICPLQQMDGQGNVINTFHSVEELTYAGFNAYNIINHASRFMDGSIDGYYWRFVGGDWERTSNGV